MLKRIRITLFTVTVALLVACGGGGGGGVGGGADGATSKSIVFSGTAAVGVALGAASIQIYDVTGALAGSGTSDAAGQYSIAVTSVAKAPYVLKLIKDEITLHALHGTAVTGTVNITPLSEAVAAMLSPTGASSGLLASLQAGPTSITESSIQLRRDVVSSALAGVISAAGVNGDVFTTPFTANGKGQDKLLDAVVVNSVSAGLGNGANVQITIKIATDPETPLVNMPSVNLSSGSSLAQASAERLAVGVFSAVDLPSDNAGALYMDLLANLNNCYREAPMVRTDGNTLVNSAACKKVFLNNDPTQYLNFGQRVGSAAQFAGMFTYTGDVEFKPVANNYLVQDLNGVRRGDGVGRAIVGMSWVNEQGNRENIMLYVTKYTLNGQQLLGLSGDRNTNPWAVVSHNQLRGFPLRADRALDYVQSSYLISVRDLIQSGKSAVNYATVTAPNRKKVLLATAPGGASRDLAICRQAEVDLSASPIVPKNTEISTYPASGGSSSRPKYYCTGTSKSLTFAQKFITSSETRLPSDIKDVGILRPLDDAGQPFTPDSQTLANYPSVGVWSIEYTFMDGTKKTQKTWSVARPMTVEELMGSNGPDAVAPRYTAGTIAELKALKTQSTNLLTPCYVPDTTCDSTQSPVSVPSAGGFRLAWTDSSLPVTALWISGRRNADTGNRTWISGTDATSWDDQLFIRSTARSAEIKCSKQSSSDEHCIAGLDVGATGGYHPKSWMTYSELWGKDAEQRNIMRSYNWYQPRRQDGTPF